MIGTARWSDAVQRIALTLWVGAIWGIGYVVVPVLFAGLRDRAQAGEIAGQLFDLISYMGIVCACVILLTQAWLAARRAVSRKFLGAIVAMLLVTLLAQFIVVPQMLSIQQQAVGGLVPGTPLHMQFTNWHHVATALFVVNSVLGMLAVLTMEPDLLKRTSD